MTKSTMFKSPSLEMLEPEAQARIRGYISTLAAIEYGIEFLVIPEDEIAGNEDTFDWYTTGVEDALGINESTLVSVLGITGNKVPILHRDYLDLIVKHRSYEKGVSMGLWEDRKRAHQFRKNNPAGQCPF